MSGEHHGDAVFVARLDALLVAHAAAGLDDGGHAVACQRVDVVAERTRQPGLFPKTAPPVQEKIFCAHNLNAIYV